MKKVLVLSTINGIAGRNGLTGIFDYVNAGHDWSIRFLQNPDDLGASVLEGIVRDGLDGVVVSPRTVTAQIRRLFDLPVPVVMIHDPDEARPRRKRAFALLKNDDRAVGRLAADYFLAKAKFRAYAFLPTPSHTKWSDERREGFSERLKGKGITPVLWQPEKMGLHDFLKALPKPAAVFGATDLEAIDALTACRKLRLGVPARVAVLGVDDDELMCESTQPTLSSVHTDDVALGRRAAAELGALMAARRPRPPAQPILIPPTGVTERNSTRAVPPSGHLIQEALFFVRQHLGEGIGVDDVVRHLNVSPSLLRERFRTVYGKSLRDVIIDLRIKAAMSLLRKTTAPVHAIARKVGFRSVAHFVRTFGKKTNMTPLAYRA